MYLNLEYYGRYLSSSLTIRDSLAGSNLWPFAEYISQTFVSSLAWTSKPVCKHDLFTNKIISTKLMIELVPIRMPVTHISAPYPRRSTSVARFKFSCLKKPDGWQAAGLHQMLPMSTGLPTAQTFSMLCVKMANISEHKPVMTLMH